MTNKEYNKKERSMVGLFNDLLEGLDEMRRSVEKKPREMHLYFSKLGNQWREVTAKETPTVESEVEILKASNVEVIHVKEVIE